MSAKIHDTLELMVFVTCVQPLSLETQKYLVCISDKCGDQQSSHGGWMHRFHTKKRSIGKLNEASCWAGGVKV